ncbi:protein MODIFIER OF SNC1 11 isoform X1 [Carex rostrata]
MDSQQPEIREDTSKETLDAPPPTTAAKPTPLPSNPSSAMSTAPPSSDPSVVTNDETKNEETVEKGEQKAAVPPVSPSTGSVTDLEKKMRRAERFGVAVVMSEEEKRNNRAERFGTGTQTVRKGGTGQVEEQQKKKARAERFGLSTNATVDEEAKKKARLERFSPGLKVDASEEEKKKEARALRFAKNSTSPSQPSTNDSSDLNKDAASVVGTA